ncbi:MAG TPA: class I SAM-dependent methyltransferase [Candidatus Binatia bacterium]|nr:class I SAM-dependent methyltransferase [Candidatus Binatia bacterium]
MDEGKVQAFLGRFVGDLGGVTTIAMVALANELGLYQAMDGKGPLDAAALAAATGCNRRLLQEWLDQQAAAGYLAYDAETGRYELPAEHAFALAQRQSPAFVAGGSLVVASMFHDLERVAAAFRGDGGLPWGDHHPHLFRGTAEFFRPGYQTNLTTSWIPALDGVEARLRAGIRVADIGCGYGISTIVMAKAYPASRIHGFDYHAPSIEVARQSAHDAAMGERVHFDVARANAFSGRFDLICFFDCLHDMGDPVGIAKHARAQLDDGGTVMLVEPFAHDDRATNHGLASAKVFYGASTFICTPNSLSQEVGRAMGAQAGEAGMRAVFDEAGYSHFRRVTETPFNIVYEARA